MAEETAAVGDRNQKLGQVVLLVILGIAAAWYFWPTASSRAQAVMNELGACALYARAWQEEPRLTTGPEITARSYVIGRFTQVGNSLADAVEDLSRQFGVKINTSKARETALERFRSHVQDARAGHDVREKIESFFGRCLDARRRARSL